MKGAEQTMNGMEKVFESLSSIDKASEFAASSLASPMMGNAVLLGDDLYLYNSDDQRYSNTISSTSSTRSTGHVPHSSSKFAKQNIVSLGGSKSSRSKSKSSSKTSPSSQTKFESPDGHEFDMSQVEDELHSKKNAVSGLDVKRINRYGTIPKGAQINAFLDSLRQDEQGLDVGLDMNNEQLFNMSAMERFHLDPTRDMGDIVTLQHNLPTVPPLPSPSLFPSTFAKDERQARNVAILDDISNHSRQSSKDDGSTGSGHHHFNFTRQKSDLTHSKTSENVALGGGKGGPKGVRPQLRGPKANHLQLLKSVASPRLPKSTLLESSSSGRPDLDDTGVPAHFAGFRNDIVDTLSFPTPPAQFANDFIDGGHHHHSKLAKSDSFDFVSLNSNMNPSALLADSATAGGEQLVPLDSIISTDDFPPPPPPNLDSLNEELSAHSSPDKVDSVKSNDAKEKVKPKKPSKDDKKAKKEMKEAKPAKDGKVEPKAVQNSAFMSELYESFRIKAQKDATKGQLQEATLATELVESKAKTKQSAAKEAKESKQKSSNSSNSRSSFLFKRATSKPEPNCPAPAVPTLAANISQSTFYTKDLTESPAQNAAVEAEYVTPVQKKALPLKTLVAEQMGDPESQAPEAKPKKSSKIASFFNGGSKSIAKAKPTDPKKAELAEMDDQLTKSVISNSGYDADDESKRHSAGNISGYKKFWESQSSTTGEADSGLGSCASSNAATSKSNDSVISMGSIGSTNSAKAMSHIPTAQPTVASSSPKLNHRGNSKTSTLFAKKSTKGAPDSSSVDNIPQKCSNAEANSQQESASRPT